MGSGDGQADLRLERVPRRLYEDGHGAFDWAAPDDDVFAFITDLMRSAGTYLYGRRMYDTMAVWETDAALAAQSDLTSDFANVWQVADKIVYSTAGAADRHALPEAISSWEVRPGSNATSIPIPPFVGSRIPFDSDLRTRPIGTGLGHSLGQREEAFGARALDAEPSLAATRGPPERHFGKDERGFLGWFSRAMRPVTSGRNRRRVQLPAKPVLKWRFCHGWSPYTSERARRRLP